MNDVTKLIRSEHALQRWELRLGRALRQVLRLRKRALYYRLKCGFPYLGPVSAANSPQTAPGPAGQAELRPVCSLAAVAEQAHVRHSHAASEPARFEAGGAGRNSTWPA